MLYNLNQSNNSLYYRYLLQREAAQTKGLRTSKQLADLRDKRNHLLKEILKWRRTQLIYMPQVTALIPDTTSESESGTDEPFPELMPLFLPSSLPNEIRSVPELEKIRNMELKLRVPQAHDALATIQRQRRVIQGLWQFKKLNASGTGNKPNTRMVDLYKRFDDKTQRAANKY